MSTERYAEIPRRSTMDHPYGPFVGTGGSQTGYASRVDLVRKSDAAMVVEILAISNPHFNSDDGGYWLRREGESNIGVIQDVRLRVLERWGDHVGLGDEINLTVYGGQVQYTLSDEQARAEELEHGGTFLAGGPPEVSLTVGEQALLFIDSSVVGWKTGQRPALWVRGSDYGKFRRAGDRVENAKRPDWSGPVANLRDEIVRELGRDCPPARPYCP